MKKILFIFLLNLTICSNVSAESYYFKKCKLSENAYGDYVIDLEKNKIYVDLKTIDGKEQKFTDEIKLVTKERIISEIKKRENTKFSTQYYLDVEQKAVIRQLYKKESAIDIILPEGPQKHAYCSNVKADWYKVEDLESIEEEKKAKIKAEKEAERKKIKEKKEKEEIEIRKRLEIEKNRRKISIISEKWIKLSKYNSSSGKELKIKFDKKANELCAETGNFVLIEKKLDVVTIDYTPTYGTEPVVKLRIDGVVDCK